MAQSFQAEKTVEGCIMRVFNFFHSSQIINHFHRSGILSASHPKKSDSFTQSTHVKKHDKLGKRIRTHVEKIIKCR